MASAKLANSTVNHSQRVICRLNLKLLPWSMNKSTVVRTEPISTTNMTGFLAMERGLSLRRASTRARRTMRGSNSERWLATAERS